MAVTFSLDLHAALATDRAGACSVREANNRAAIIPSIYREGYEKAREKDPELADAYIRHTTFGDPLADRVAEELASSDSDHGVIRSALDRHEDPSVDRPFSALPGSGPLRSRFSAPSFPSSLSSHI